MKLFLDANVIFTAAYSPGGVAARFFDLAAAGHCTLCSSAFAIEEAIRNLTLKAPSKISNVTRLLSEVVVVPEPSPGMLFRAESLPLPYKDAPIMAAAIACSADLLVTGDRRDFGHLFGRDVDGVRVLIPRDALEEVLRRVITS